MSITRVQANSLSSTTSSAAITFTSAQTAGNAITVEVEWPDNATFSTISDTKGNTYVQCGSEQHLSSINTFARMYVAANIASAAASGNTLTVTISATPSGHLRLFGQEYSGLTTTSPNDVNGGNNGTSDGSTGAVTISTSSATTVAHGLNVGFFVPNNGPISAGSGYTSIATDGGDLVEEVLDNGATGVQTATGTDTTVSDLYIGMIATFKPAGVNTVSEDDSFNPSTYFPLIQQPEPVISVF